MTRGEFITAIAGAATAVKAVGQTAPDGSAPKTKRLLLIECGVYMSAATREIFADCLKPYGDRYGIEFLILGPDFHIVDPLAPQSRTVTYSIDARGTEPEQIESHIRRSLDA